MAFADDISIIDKLIEEQHWPDAESRLHRCLNKYGSQVSLSRRLAQVLYESGDLQGAWRVSSLLDLKDTQHLVLNCTLAYQLGRIRQGRRLFEKLLKIPFEYTSSIENLSRVMYSAHCFEDTLRLLRMVLRSGHVADEHSFQIYAALALCSWILEKPESEVYARKALTFDSEDPLALSLLANAMFDKGDKLEALNLFEKVGFQRLLDLQCEEGAKRLMRWNRQHGDDGGRLRHLEHMWNVYQKEREWSTEERFEYESRAGRLSQCQFFIDCPESGRLVGCLNDPQIDALVVVSMSLEDERRVKALEEASYYDVPCYQDSEWVELLAYRVGDKVIDDPNGRLSQYISQTSVVISRG